MTTGQNKKEIEMANFNNMGTGKKLLGQILNTKGVKHWFNQKNLTDNNSSKYYNVQPKILNSNKK